MTLFQSPPGACPYLPGRIEQLILTPLPPDNSAGAHSLLCQAGFRRSGNVLYRPACPSCNACIPVRVRALDFSLNRPRWNRVIRRNQDISITSGPPRASSEGYTLFQRYQQRRYPLGSMARMSYDDYARLLGESPVQTLMYEAHDTAGTLAAVMIADTMADGLSAVYGFFDPNQPKRSLGTRMILHLIHSARTLDKPYVYLGYWVAQSPHMSYKSQFQPLEMLATEGWQRFL